MNRLKGVITKLDETEHIALVQVQVGNDLFSAVLLNSDDMEDKFKIGEDVFVVFKEAEVSIGVNLRGGLSMRNRMESRVLEVIKGKVLTKLILDYQGEKIISVITTASAIKLELKENTEVEGLVKSNEITLMRMDG